MGLEFAILYKGTTAKGKKMVKSMMAWPEDKVLETLKNHFNKTNDIDQAFKATIKEFKKQSVKIP